jgi:DNA phosphorothioation-associated putative methyltransferase
MATGAVPIQRSRTAIARNRLSMPARVALDDAVLNAQTSVLDYGCGRGDDVRHLTALGIRIQGWDPHYRPDPPPQPADVVLLTYVLNVIDDVNERKATLGKALSLARHCVVASTRLRWEEPSVRGTDHHDGVVTGRGTFQALHRPEEFRLWTHINTGIRPASPCPEVVYLFTDSAARIDYIHRRYRKDAADDAGFDPMQRLAAHLRTFGRPPRRDERPQLVDEVMAAYGTLRKALTAAELLLEPGEVPTAGRRRKGDLVVALALDAFYGRPRFGQLPPTMQADVRAFFGSYRDACRLADKLLVAAGQPDLIKRAAASSKTGKLTPTALYIHASALDRTAPLLRIYEHCARVVAGSPEGANLVKLHHDQPAVSYLSYPDFDKDPHPRLATSLFVHIGDQKTRWLDYRKSTNRPLLHRKEEFVASDHPDASKWARLTRQEKTHNLYDEPARIGLERGWDELLCAKQIEFFGHRLTRRR